MKKTLRIAAIIAIVTLAACEKEPQLEGTTENIPVQQSHKSHALILNEGNPIGNDASLSYLDLASGTLTNNWFKTKNNRNLGSLGGDMVVYGSKAYVTVSTSGTLEVIDTATGLSQQYSMTNNYPNRIAAYGGKLYITCHNPCGVMRIDTTSPGNVEAICLLGDYNPEGIAVLNGKLFVASSYISNSSGVFSYDNKVYMIDINDFAATTTLTVLKNPQRVIPVDNNHLVVNCWGEWDETDWHVINEGTAIIDAQTLSVSTTPQLLTKMAVYNGTVYGWSSRYDNAGNQVINYMSLNPTTLETSQLPIRLDDNDTYNPYAIAIHPDNGDIYITTDGGLQANKGDVYCFSANGTRRWRNQVGVFPSKIVFY